MDEPSRSRAVLNCLLCALGFLLTAMAIHRFAPMRNVPVVKNKLLYFAQHKNEFDAVFIGTSRTQAGVKSAVFDAVLQAKGIKMRSFNLGVAGLWPPEEFWMIRRVLAQRPQSLKWIFLELTPIAYPGGDDPEIRNIVWRDWKETALILREKWQRALDSRPEPLKIRLPKNLKRSTQRRWAQRIEKIIPSSVVVRIRFVESGWPHFARFIRNQTNIGLARSEEH